jgi:signal recognition particle receptor subunit beta
MAFVNLARREIHCKIVYYGPGLCGKTTNLVALHQRIPPARRSELVRLQTPGERTLYFDFLPLDLGEIHGLHTRFHLYTVPGQVSLRAMRRLVLQGADGVVFVADSDPARFFANRQSLDDLRQNLARLGRPLDALPLVLQYNKRDLPGRTDRVQLDRLLNAAGHPVFEASAVRGEGVSETLRAALQRVLAGLARRGPGRQAASA